MSRTGALVLAVATAWACGDRGDKRASAGAVARDAAIASPTAPRVRLAVLLVVDQLPSWTFERDRRVVRHGIARLLREGVYFPRGVLPFAMTSTAPGHAALGSGAPPAISGILANNWYRRSSDKVMSAVSDPSAPVHVIGEAPKEVRGAGPAQLKVEGVADSLRRATGGKGRSVSVSIKSRAAILALGKRPDLAVWYEHRQLAMTTSKHYVDRPPPWLIELARRSPVKKRLTDVWQPLDPALCARHTGIPDAAPGEGNDYGLGTEFPHALARSKEPGRAIRMTPSGTDLIFDTAIAAIDAERLGRDDVPDLLAISVSSHDYAGHAWGQESWERFDLFLRMDRRIGELLDHLDRVVGKDRWALILTSDHGAVPMVEQSKARGFEAHRVFTKAVEAVAEKAAARLLGKGDWIASVSASTVYLSARVPAARRDAVIDAVVATLEKLPGLALAARTDRIAGKCDERKGVEAMACRSVDRQQSGEVFITAGPRSFVTTSYTTGTSHGSPNPSDTTVPIILYRPGVTPRTVTRAVSMLQVAPTLAALVGAPAPPHSRMKALVDVGK